MLSVAEKRKLVEAFVVDRRAFARAAADIVDKEGHKGRLRFTPIQERANLFCDQVDALGVALRVINCKARQVRLTTYWMLRAFHKWVFSTDTSVMNFMGDTAKTTDQMREMWNVYYDGLPSFLARARTVQSRTTYRLKNGTRTRWHTALSTNRRAGQGSTGHVLVATEAPYFRDATKVFLAILNTIPAIAGTMAIIEGTANGASGYFYETWLAAVQHVEELCSYYGATNLEDLLFNLTGWGDKPDAQGITHPNGYWDGSWLPLFFAWHEDPGYVRDPALEHVTEDTLSDDERAGIAAYGWTFAQIAWRRMAIRDLCGRSIDRFNQEYPASWELAFLSSGRPVYDMSIVSQQMMRTQQLREKYSEQRNPVSGIIQRIPAIQQCELAWVRDKQDPYKYAPRYDIGGFVMNRSELRAYAYHATNGRTFIRHVPRADYEWRYCIGADVAEFVGGGKCDYSVAMVLDRVMYKFVAMFRAQTSLEDFAIVLAMLSAYYDKAPLLVENNKSGPAVINPLLALSPGEVLHGLRYERGQEVEDPQRYGFLTTERSKRVWIDENKRMHREKPEAMDFHQYWLECATFSNEKGKAGAEGKRLDPEIGNYDDTQPATGLALIADRRLPPPVLRKTHDEVSEQSTRSEVRRWLPSIADYA